MPYQDPDGLVSRACALKNELSDYAFVLVPTLAKAYKEGRSEIEWEEDFLSSPERDLRPRAEYEYAKEELIRCSLWPWRDC